MTVVDDWPNFQIDGYGTWLWSLGQPLELARVSRHPEEFVDSVDRVARYLATFALSPCYDVWEENGDDAATRRRSRACTADLNAAARLLGDESTATRQLRSEGPSVRETGRQNGFYVKSSNNGDVDASSLWLAAPFGVVERRRRVLCQDCLSHRGPTFAAWRNTPLPTDVYFGSGAWPVLTGSLGWHYGAVGDRAKVPSDAGSGSFRSSTAKVVSANSTEATNVTVSTTKSGLPGGVRLLRI